MDYGQAIGLIYDELLEWARTAVRYVPKLVLAILIIMVFTVLARWISRWLVRGFDRFSDNYSLINLTGALVRVLVMAVGLFIALSVLHLDKAVTSLLAGAGVIALAVGFAFQDLTANFISGTMIALARPIQVGDSVETNGFSGKVLNIKLRSIVLDNGKGQTVEIPSKDVFQNPIVNSSRAGEQRIELSAGISYLDDLDKAQRVAKETLSKLPFVLTDRPVEMFYRSFGDISIQFVAWFWINPAASSAMVAQSEAIKALKDAYETNEILIVFAGHTFDLKQKLADKQAGPAAS